MNSPSVPVILLAGGEIAVWLDESGCICLKNKNKYNDPVELSEDEALDLARVLVQLAEGASR